MSWRIPITATCGGAFDSRKVAGVDARASEGADALDRSEPPRAPSQTISLYFLAANEAGAQDPSDRALHGDRADVSVSGVTRRSVDIRPSILAGTPQTRGRRWVFDVALSGAAGEPLEAELNFNDVDRVPADLEVQLIDYALESVTDLRQQRQYRYVATRRDELNSLREARFELVIGTRDFVRAARTGLAASPRVTRLLPPAPNPMGNAATVRFETAVAGRVALVALDVSGRRVRTLLDGPIDPGRHELLWSGQDDQGRRLPAGVYWLRLAAPDRTETRRLAKLP